MRDTVQKEVCQYNQRGYCKHGAKCFKFHENETCKAEVCKAEVPVGAEILQFAEFLHILRLQCKNCRFFAENLHQNYEKKKH